MLRFIAFGWDVHDAANVDRLRHLRASIGHANGLSVVLDVPGMLVYAGGFVAGATECCKLHGDAGAILGTIFRRYPSAPRVSHVGTAIDEGESNKIVNSNGRKLLESYWGRYVAFIHDIARHTTWVIQDPSAGHSVYRTKIGRMVVYFAEESDFRRFFDAKRVIDWEYVASHVVVPIAQSSATALINVFELHGGECDEVEGGHALTKAYWRPSVFASRRTEDMTEACDSLREVVMHCVRTWAGCYEGLMVQLSGGLDSSIVVGCLKGSRCASHTTCITVYTGDPGLDERAYARLSASDAGFELIEQRISHEGHRFETFRDMLLAPRPGFYVSCLLERGIVSLARMYGADAIVTGSVGDGVFGEMTDIRAAVDYICDHGMKSRYWQIAKSTAELSGVSLARVISRSLPALWAGPLMDAPLNDFKMRPMLISSELIERGREKPEKYKHAWTIDAADLPPGKRQHIKMMAQRAAVRTPTARFGDPEYVFPLASQLILELCAAIPVYVLTEGARSRAVARKAFEAHVPAKILARRDKGNPAAWVRDLVSANASFARECLLDGQLVKNRILDGRRVEQVFNGKTSDVSASEIAFLVGTELWSQQTPRESVLELAASDSSVTLRDKPVSDLQR